ncbi:MAG: hypothetical protein RR739_08365 [Clostridia bacterium]
MASKRDTGKEWLINMERQSRATLWPVIGALVVLTLTRIPVLAMHPVSLFASETLMTLLLALNMRARRVWPGVVFAVAIPLAAWMMDLEGGADALVYGATLGAMAAVFVPGHMFAEATVGEMRVGLASAAFAALAALTGLLISTMGTVITLIAAQKMTFGNACVYAMSRQMLPMIAHAVGGFAGLWLAERRARTTAA